MTISSTVTYTSASPDCSDCLRIISVEDNQVNQFALTTLIESNFHYTVDTANNGQECLDLLINKTKCENPDCMREGFPAYPLIFMDFNMPIMDGREATSLIRKNSGYDHI